MRRVRLEQGILACIFVMLSVGFICRGVNWLLSPLADGSRMIGQLLWSEWIQCGVILLLVWFFWRKVQGRSWRELGLCAGSGRHWLGWAFLHGLALFAVMIAISALMDYVLPGGLHTQEAARIVGTAAAPWEMAAALAVTVLMAPVSEEILFRGFFYHTLHSRFGVAGSVALTALIFGCMHFDPVRIVPLTLGGIWLNVLSLKTGSLYASMVAHGVWNLIMTIMIYLT